MEVFNKLKELITEIYENGIDGGESTSAAIDNLEAYQQTLKETINTPTLKSMEERGFGCNHGMNGCDNWDGVKCNCY